MKPINAFDPATFASGQGEIDTLGINKNEQLMLYNDSIYALQLEFSNGSIDIIPALWNKDFIIKNTAIGKVKWSIYNQLSLANNPISSVYGILYESDEHVASVNASMQRSVVSSIPGGVNANLSNLVNTGNNPGTQVINVQPNDVPGTNPTISADNSGNVIVKSDNAGVLTTLLQLIAGIAAIVKIGATTIVTEILGNLLVDGNLIIPNAVPLQGKNTSNVARDILYVTGGNDTVVQAANLGQSIVFNNQNGATYASINANGYNGPTGDTLCRLGSFSGTGSGTVGHTLGASPGFAAITTHQSGSSSNVGYFSETTTQITVTMGAAVSYFGWCSRRN